MIIYTLNQIFISLIDQLMPTPYGCGNLSGNMKLYLERTGLVWASEINLFSAIEG
jgi:predicted TIM-barrel enzyme